MGNNEEMLQKPKKKQVIDTNEPTILEQNQTFVSPYQVMDKAAIEWDTVRNFHQNSMKMTKTDNTYTNQFENLDLYELRNLLDTDSEKKSKTFERMFNSVDNLLELAQKNGTKEIGNGKFLSMDFASALKKAKTNTSKYISSRKKSFYFWEKGKRRVDIAERIEFLLSQLDEAINKRIEKLDKDKKKEAEYVKKGYSKEKIEELMAIESVEEESLDLTRLLKSGLFGPSIDKEMEESISKKWIAGNFTKELLEMIGDKKGAKTKEEKDSLIAFIEGTNERLLANKMTVTILVEADVKATLGISVLKDDLKRYLNEKLQANDLLTLDPRVIAEKTKDLIEEYYENNKEELAASKERIKTLGHQLPLGKNFDQNRYLRSIIDFPQVINMLLASDEEFEAQLEEIKQKISQDDKLIEDELKKHFSPATRNEVIKRLNAYMGGLRLFGSTESVLNQVGLFRDEMQYIAPDVYKTERMLKSVMSSLDVPECYRDSFLDYITNGVHEELKNYKFDFWKVRGEDFARNLKANTKNYNKKNTVLLSKDVWDQLESLKLAMGEMKPEQCELVIKQLIESGRMETGKKLSIKEYITKRNFEDQEKLPVRLEHIAVEKEKISNIGNSYDDMFYIQLFNDGKKLTDNYEAVDGIYRDIKTFNNIQKHYGISKYKEVKKARIEKLHEHLKNEGVSRDKFSLFDKKLAYLMDGVIDISDENVFADVRLRNERENLEKFGVHSFEDVLARLDKDLIKCIENNQENDKATEVKEKYEKALETISDYDDGAFENIAEILADIPEVFKAMMDPDPKVLRDVIENIIVPRFTPVMDSLSKLQETEFHAQAILTEFIYSNRREIFNGTDTGTSEEYYTRVKQYGERIHDLKIKGNLLFAQKAMENQLYALFHRNESENPDPKKHETKRRLRGDEIVLISEILYRLMLEADDVESFEGLLDKKTTEEKALKLLDENLGKLGNDYVFDKEITDKVTIPTSSLNITEGQKKRNEIISRKNKGTRATKKYLGFDNRKLNNIRQGKSLVRVNAKDSVSLTYSKKSADLIRGALKEQIDFLLPDVIKDAIIETYAINSKDIVEDYIYEINGSFHSLMYQHAVKLYNLYHYLLTEDKAKPAMSEEEAQMYVVHHFGIEKNREKLYNNDDLSVTFKSIEESDDFIKFRQNYLQLKNIENMDINDPAIKKDFFDITRDIRAALITGQGVRTGEKLETSIMKCSRYLEETNNLTKIIRKIVEEYRNGEDGKNFISDYHLNAEVLSLRNYFSEDLINDLTEGKEFDSKAWYDKVKEIYGNDLYRKNLLGFSESVSSENYEKYRKNVSGSIGNEALIEKVIENSQIFFHGRLNKYQALDSDQKKFFAVALLMMDRGTIGYGTNGTSALLLAKDKRKESMDEISAELDKYVRGENYNLKIDYTEALYKLCDYNINSFLNFGEKYKINVEAYEKAMQFAKAVYEKKNKEDASGEKDLERMKEGTSSIEAAFMAAGKHQKNEVDKTRDIDFKPEDVVERLLGFAKKDQVSRKSLVLGGALAVTGAAVISGVTVAEKKIIAANQKEVEEQNKQNNIKREEKKKNPNVAVNADRDAKKVTTTNVQEGAINAVGSLGLGIVGAGIKVGDKPAKQYARMRMIIKRLEKISKNKSDMNLFVRIMQDRTVLDKSTSGSDSHVDQDLRDRLFEALTGDVTIAGKTLEGFSDNESCHNAYNNALSFQLRDDTFFKDKIIGKEHFAGGALDRKTMVDWDLIEKAFEFMDEIMNRRATIAATGKATDFIRQAGNNYAIKELDELEKNYKEKKDFDLAAFESKLKDNLNKDMDNHNPFTSEPSINSAYAGYMSLTNAEKNLFFKVLQNRDLLDISKKNYIQNYFGCNDRNYLNPSGRNKLVSEFIESSLSDGIGVQIDEQAYYNAMKTLLSTQVSDVVDYRRTKDIAGKQSEFMSLLPGRMTGIFSYERFGFFARGTAIDWKLFKRALQFVNRAKKELQAQEGNALLYRGAGDLLENGNMVLDYKFLRRNIHKTGNWLTRYIGKKIAGKVKETTGIDKTLDTILTMLDGAEYGVGTIAGNDGAVGTSINWLKGKVSGVKDIISFREESTFEKIGVKTAEEEKEEKEEAAKTKEQKEEEKKKKQEAEKKRREELLLFEQLKEGFDNIVAEKKSIESVADAMGTLVNDKLGLYLNKQTTGVAAELDKENIVNKATTNMKADDKNGDFRDAIKSMTGMARFSWEKLDSVPFVSNLKKLLIYGVKQAVFNGIGYDEATDSKIFYNKNGERIVPNNRDEEIKIYEENFEKKLMVAAGVLTEKIFGQEFVKDIKNVEQAVYDVKEFITDNSKKVTKAIGYMNKTVDHVKGITNSIHNIYYLKSEEKFAGSKREEDDIKVEERTRNRLTGEQAKKAKDMLSTHRGMSELSGTVTTAMQGFNIASESINLAIDTVNTCGLKLNVGQEVVSTAIKEGLEFLMFASRIFADRNAIRDYLFTTPNGINMVKKLIDGFNKSGSNSPDTAEKSRLLSNVLMIYQNNSVSYTPRTLNEIRNEEGTGVISKGYYKLKKGVTWFAGKVKNAVGNAPENIGDEIDSLQVIDVISDCQGYEHTSELIEDIGMNMAQSIVFCSSKYNPSAETKLMAIAVMTVLGFKPSEIGNTSQETVARVFKGFKMAR